jgi:molybdenum cofactor cytidylyltransferase
MWFGELPTALALNCLLAHSVRVDGRRISKGTIITGELQSLLQRAGVDTVTVARLDGDDLHEDDAASCLADAVAGEGINTSTASTGRVNLHAANDGLFLFDRDAVLALNAVDTEITFATLAENTWVPAGRMVATIKIIPYAVARNTVELAIQAFGGRKLRVVAPQPKQALLLQTTLSALKPSVHDKTRLVTERRLEARGAMLVDERRCSHRESALTSELTEAAKTAVDWLLIVGASAISDRRDVIPAAIEAAGGEVIRYGLPVDPGNLLLLGRIEEKVVLGLPGCARSPKYNGLDQLLDRLACNIAIDDQWLNSLSVGGLLDEVLDRPQPRVSANRAPKMQGLVLAAGLSRRMGDRNKLLLPWKGATMLEAVVRALRDSTVTSTVVVTGHEHQRIENLLHAEAVSVCYNPAYEQGMGHSLARGISQLDDADAVVVCLGDMPAVNSNLIDQLIEAAGRRAADVIVVPVHRGKRGNPVLVGKSFFDTLLQNEGDSGARYLMRQYPERLIEVDTDDAAVLQDFDTPESLEQI